MPLHVPRLRRWPAASAGKFNRFLHTREVSATNGGEFGMRGRTFTLHHHLSGAIRHRPQSPQSPTLRPMTR